MPEKIVTKQRVQHLQRLLPVIVVFLLTLTALRDNFDLDPGRDWDIFHADLLSARRSLLVEHELPFWMPYRGGGHDAFGDPWSAWLSPVGLLVLVFGFAWGSRLFVAFGAAVGMFGALRLGNRLRLSVASSVLSGSVLFLSSVLALRTASGLASFVFGLVLLPWLVLTFLSKTRRSGVLCGLLLAVVIFSGDANHYIWHSFFLFVLAVVLTVFHRNFRPLRKLLLVAACCAVFSAPKLVPMTEIARTTSRSTTDERYIGALTPRLLVHSLLNPRAGDCLEKPLGEYVVLLRTGELASLVFLSQDGYADLVPGTLLHWANAGAYVGWGVILLAAVGLTAVLRTLVKRWTDNRQRTVAVDVDRSQCAVPDAVAGDDDVHFLLNPGREPTDKREQTELLIIRCALGVTAALFMWIAFGRNVQVSVWALLQRLPVFSSVRCPSRVMVYVVFFLGLLAGDGLTAIRRVLRDRLGVRTAGALAWATVAVLAVVVHLPARRVFRYTYCEQKENITTAAGKFVQLRGQRSDARTYYGPSVVPYVRAGAGVVNGYCALPFYRCARAVTDPGYRGEAFFASSENGQVSKVNVTARHIDVVFSCSTPATLVINQNWRPGWQAVRPAGVPVNRYADGRIAVAVDPGTDSVRLRYTSPGLGIGLLVLVVGVGSLLLFMHRQTATRNVQSTNAVKTEMQSTDNPETCQSTAPDRTAAGAML